MKNQDRNMRRSIREAFRLAEDVVQNWETYPDQFVAISATSSLANQLFSPEKQRLLEAIKEHGSFESVHALAGEVRRDPTRVGRDLQPLVEAGLVRTVTNGKRKRIEPTHRPVLIQ